MVTEGQALLSTISLNHAGGKLSGRDRRHFLRVNQGPGLPRGAQHHHTGNPDQIVYLVFRTPETAGYDQAIKRQNHKS